MAVGTAAATVVATATDRPLGATSSRRQRGVRRRRGNPDLSRQRICAAPGVAGDALGAKD